MCFGIFNEYCWDSALTGLRDYPEFDKKGPHALCDINGNSLELSDVKDGMTVKIRAKNVWHDYAGYEYLYTADGRYGKYLAKYNIKT